MTKILFSLTNYFVLTSHLSTNCLTIGPRRYLNADDNKVHKNIFRIECLYFQFLPTKEHFASQAAYVSKLMYNYVYLKINNLQTVVDTSS